MALPLCFLHSCLELGCPDTCLAVTTPIWRFLRGKLETEGCKNSVVSMHYGPFLKKKKKKEVQTNVPTLTLSLWLANVTLSLLICTWRSLTLTYSDVASPPFDGM